MTIDDVKKYKLRVERAGASFDQNKMIEETFNNTDILITDISSIIYTYLLYEKPVIFCNTNVPKSPSLEALMECMYLANNWNDVEKWIRTIINGEDRLKEKRHICAEKIRRENRNAVDNIVSYLIDGNNII